MKLDHYTAAKLGFVNLDDPAIEPEPTNWIVEKAYHLSATERHGYLEDHKDLAEACRLWNVRAKYLNESLEKEGITPIGYRTPENFLGELDASEQPDKLKILA